MKINVQDLDIDKFALDQELQKQPSLYFNWNLELVRLDEVRNRAKENVELVRAKLDSEIRANAQKRGEKTTEGSINSAIIMDNDYQEAMSYFIDARKYYAEMQGAIEALNHKKSSLENMVKLYLNSYYSEIEVNADNQRGLSDKTSDRITRQLNKKKIKV